MHRGLAKEDVVLVDLVKKQLGMEKVFPIHRLDRQTSGVILFAQDGETAQALQVKLAAKQIKKQYIALVRGIVPNDGYIDHPVPQKEGGQRVNAQTRYSFIASTDTLPRATSLVLAMPETGRFHQIRRHLKHINHPVIGDANYGKGALNREMKQRYGLSRLALHALRVELIHPVSQKCITITAPLPADLTSPLRQMGFCPSIFEQFTNI